MKKVIALACFMFILTLTNCSHSVVQVDEVESGATEESGNNEEIIEETIIDEESKNDEIVDELAIEEESTTVIDIPTDETPATSIVLSEFGNVKEINISKYVNEIELSFDSDSVSKLKNIYVHEDNEIYYDIDGVLFMKETATLLYYPNGKIDTYYKIPDGTKTIASYAFYGNQTLESISFAESVERIEKYVIYKCDSIKNIYINSNDTVISNLSFVYEHEDERVFSETFKHVEFNFGYDRTLAMLENKVGDVYWYVTNIFPKTGVEYTFYESISFDPDYGMEIPFAVFYDESQTGSLRNGNGKWDGKNTTYGDFEVVEYEQEIHIWDYIGTESHIIIPERINDKPVTAIAEWTFWCVNSPNVKELTIPRYLHDIRYIYLSPGNKGINVFPPTLENIHVDKDNPYLYSIDGALFSYSNSKLLWCPDKYEVYEIPDGTKSISYYAFTNNNKLKELIVPSSVEKIDQFILRYCEEITTIRLPDKYVNIDESAFDYTLNYGTFEVYFNESIKNIYIDTELSVYENEVKDFYEYFFDRFRIENVTVHFKDYKFTYADNTISKYSADGNELIERYDCNPIRILSTIEKAERIYKESEARVLKLIDLTFDGVPELFVGYGRGTGQSYDIYDISQYHTKSILDEEKAFAEFHHYINTVTNESIWIMTETDFSLDNGRSEETSQISSNSKISKMIVSAIVYYESSVEYKINRDLTEIDISECETVTQAEYTRFMEEYYLSFEEVTYPSVTKVTEQYYWDDVAKETAEITPEEMSKAIDEAYNEYIALYEEFVK